MARSGQLKGNPWTYIGFLKLNASTTAKGEILTAICFSSPAMAKNGHFSRIGACVRSDHYEDFTRPHRADSSNKHNARDNHRARVQKSRRIF